MPDTVTPYIERHPKDLITAEDWNEVQVRIQKDIKDKVDKAIADKKEVEKSDDATKLGGKTPEQITKEIIDAALQELNKRTGYMRVFKMLTAGKESIVEHGLKDFPVTDIYQLQEFNVVCSEDDVKEVHTVLFYLYHSSERSIRFKDENNAIKSIPIEEGGTVHRIAFSEMLRIYDVKYDSNTTLDDLETEFWDAFYNKPNDRFDDDRDCHSPWFDRCCGEKRTVDELKKRGDWDEIWFQTRPAKTINAQFPAPPLVANTLPPDVRVDQYDFNTLGITYTGVDPMPVELPVMLLLKV